MSQKELEDAYKSSADLRQLIIHNAGGRSDPACLDKIDALCLAASGIDDDQCKKYMRDIRTQAADLFSENAHSRWNNGGLEGKSILQLQILMLLDLFNRRVTDIESSSGEPTRRPGAHPPRTT